MRTPIFVWAAEVDGETIEQTVSRHPAQCVKWFLDWLPTDRGVLTPTLESVRFVRIQLGEKFKPTAEREG